MSESQEPDVFTFSCSIANFSLAYQKPCESIEGSSNLAENLDYTKWHLRVYPRSDKVENEGYVAVFLRRADEDDGPEEINIVFSLDLVANDSTLQENHRSQGTRAVKKGLSWGFTKFISREALFKVKSMLLPRDTIKISCRIERVWPLGDPLKQETYLNTQVRREKVRFNWTIKDFSTVRDTEPHCVRFASDGMVAFNLTMRVKEDGKIQIEIRPNLSTFGWGTVLTVCRIRVLDEDRRPSSTLEMTGQHVFKGLEDVWHFAPFLSRDSLDKVHLPNDVLTLDCALSRSLGLTDSVVERTNYGELEPDERADLIADFSKLFTSMKDPDVVLRVGARSVFAHKLVLFARSPVLREVLKDKSPGAEGGHIVVDIDDVDMDTLKKMLQFIYTEETGILDFRKCLKLFAAGDIYKVVSLKEKCSVQLGEWIGVQNVCELLVAARQHSDPQLEEWAVLFLVEYWDEMSLSEEWEAFLKQNKELAAETRRRIRAERLKE